jgi:hypothetical protein
MAIKIRDIADRRGVALPKIISLVFEHEIPGFVIDDEGYICFLHIQEMFMPLDID